MVFFYKVRGIIITAFYLLPGSEYQLYFVRLVLGNKSGAVLRPSLNIVALGCSQSFLSVTSILL